MLAERRRRGRVLLHHRRSYLHGRRHGDRRREPRSSRQCEAAGSLQRTRVALQQLGARGQREIALAQGQQRAVGPLWQEVRARQVAGQEGPGRRSAPGDLHRSARPPADS